YANESQLRILHVRHTTRVGQVALVVSRKYSTASELKACGVRQFSLGVSNFRDIRLFPGLAYFDNRAHIPQITGGPPVKLSRFGKSPIISMLKYFHEVQFILIHQLFKVREYEILFYILFMCTHYLVYN